MIQSVKELLNKRKIDGVVIPGGATGHIQAADVSWNKSIKDQLREMCDQSMDKGLHTQTKGGYLRGPSLKQIVLWVLKAWSDLDKGIIIKSFRCCALSIQDGESEDNEIASFKPGKSLSSDLERLKTAMADSPFIEEGIENDPDLVIDSDREEDEDVDIE